MLVNTKTQINKPLHSKGLSSVYGGEGGIRTLDRFNPTPHFECGTFNHSATSPTASILCAQTDKHKTVLSETVLRKSVQLLDAA